MLSMRTRAAALVSGAFLAVALAAPAGAQTQEGLVNVAITDTNVQVPIAIAANLCDVNVGILAEQIRAGGASCDADAESIATRGGGGGGNPHQEGLVNVAITDTNVQAPVTVAANICDVNVGVLARQFRLGGATCEADAESIASRGRGGRGHGPRA